MVELGCLHAKEAQGLNFRELKDASDRVALATLMLGAFLEARTPKFA